MFVLNVSIHGFTASCSNETIRVSFSDIGLTRASSETVRARLTEYSKKALTRVLLKPDILSVNSRWIGASRDLVVTFLP